MMVIRFVEQWKQHVSFIDYFTTYWQPRVHQWAIKYQDYFHANQNSQGSIERWHSTLKTYLRGSRKSKSDSQIKCLLMEGYSEVELLHRLGTKFGSVAGGFNNAQPIDLFTPSQLAGVEVPLAQQTAESDSDIEVIASITGHQKREGDSTGVSRSGIADFQQEATTLFKAVCHSKRLTGQAFAFMKEASNRVLNIRAKRTLAHDIEIVESFITVPTADHGLQRKKDFLEVFNANRRKHVRKSDRAERFSKNIDEDERFRSVTVKKITTQQVLDREALESVDLNQPYPEYPAEQKKLPKRKAVNSKNQSDKNKENMPPTGSNSWKGRK
ncbi:hypothetical protein R1flu_002142 [Riccia fluitans]|uniref:Integrase catalytic domain-containing protein n=1 Tax=Riccia fluitans TaxID=41844 RepID=A0ABD1Y875_9MARC